MSVILSIERMGARGEGLAAGPDGPLHLPGALPGETVQAAVAGDRGTLLVIETPSADRIEPFCPLFGRCGGCTLQHWAPEPYAAWKRGLVVRALEREGLETEVAPLVPAGGEGRRRVTLHARQGAGGVEVGFMAARSHDLVPVDRCPVLDPALAAAPERAQVIARALAASGKPLDIQLTATPSGLDVDVRGHGPVQPRLRTGLAAVADRLDLARLSVHGDVVVERRKPRLDMGRAHVELVPGGFLQATAAGEAALATLVGAEIGRARRVMDLFCGIGPFALRLSETAAVTAYDSDAAAIAALRRAAQTTPGLKPVEAAARDLFRRPVLPDELKKIDVVVLDPPRAGAEAQARWLAASVVPRVVSVSCDVRTFTRDARILVDGGFRLVAVTPVDQFTHTPHVEIVGVFRR